MRDLTTGNETNRIITFAIPMLISNVFQQSHAIWNSIIVGQFVGKSALAAVGVSMPILFLTLSLIIGVTMGSTILIAQFYGARDREKVRAVVDTSYLFLIVSGIALTVGGILATDSLITILGVPAEVRPDAAAYLRILFAGMLPMFGYNAISAILRGIGDSKTPLYIVIAATAINVALDLLFVIGFRWGVPGVAWATVISQGIAFIGAMAVLNRANEYVRFSPRTLKFDRPMFALSLKIGLPSGIQQALVGLGMVVLQAIVNRFGTETIAAFTVATRLDMFAAMPAMNLSQAVSTFVGQNIGAGKIERVKRGYISALAVGTAISVAIGLIVVLLGKPIMLLFTPDTAIADIGARYLFIVGLFYFLFSGMFINNGVVRGAGEVVVPMIITLVALWLVRIPIALTLSGIIGSDGVWWSIPAGWFVGAACSTWYYLTGSWKKKVIVH